jgi:hypothetical protein
MISSLKNRIEELKKNDNWKQRMVDEIKQDDDAKREAKRNKGGASTIAGKSVLFDDCKSVASERSKSESRFLRYVLY